MEVGDGLKQGVGGIAVEHFLESAKGAAGGGEELRGVGSLIAVNVLDEGVDAPCAALAVGIEVLAALGADDLHSLTAAVAAVGHDLLAQILGDADDVLHQLVGVLKGGGAHALQDKAAAALVLGLGVDTEGVVDMAVAKAHGAHHGVAEVKGFQNFAQNSFSGRHGHFSSHRLSGYTPDAVFSAMAATTTGLSA